MDAKTKLRNFKRSLDKELRQFFALKTKEARKISSHASELMEYIADLTLRGGKRIRPSLFYYSYLAHGGKNKNEALKTSMAIELSETYLLIHDDVMDDDDLRRGGQTIHSSYRDFASQKYINKSNPVIFGNSIGILAGDISCALSNEILANSKFKPDYTLKAIYELNKVYTIEGYGQALDIISVLENHVTKEDVRLIHQLKTVPYTFDGPIKIGAILAGASSKSVDNLSKYSYPLGAAFQIQDDILGMFGSEEKLGKPVTSDLKEGKKTLLILDALEKGNTKQQEVINLSLGNKKATFATLRDVRKVIEETGSLENSKELADQLVKKAIASVEQLPLKSEGKKFLIDIAEYMVKREY